MEDKDKKELDEEAMKAIQEFVNKVYLKEVAFFWAKDVDSLNGKRIDDFVEIKPKKEDE